MNRACFPKEKQQNSQKMGEIHELFVLALSLVWFAGATPDSQLGGHFEYFLSFSARGRERGSWEFQEGWGGSGFH